MKRRYLLLLSLVFLLLTTPTAGAAERDELYDARVRPFLAKHCFACHDGREAQAGLRLDQLGLNFLEGKNADLWKEVIDRINLGEMPPEEEPRPNPEEAFAVVEWVGRELKRAERESRMAGGRVLLRRLNRSEYANTVRDLLRLDANFMALIEEELPADGKAEGFDRIASALLLDETQLNAYIDQAERIARKALVDAAEPPAAVVRRREFEDQWRKPRGTQEVIQYQKDTAIPTGPEPDLLRGDRVEFFSSRTYGRKGEFGGFGSLYSYDFLRKEHVPRDGYYKLKIRAGGFPGARGLPIKVQGVYMPETPMQAEFVLEIGGSLNDLQEVEQVLFLRKPPEDANPRMALSWNALHDVIITGPGYNAMNLRRLRANGALEKLIGAGAPAEEIAAAQEEVDAAIAAARVFARQPDAVVRVFNEQYKLEEVPRIVVDWVEFSGPIEPEWPPASHRLLLPEAAAGEGEEAAQVRAFLERLLPRAFRRPPREEEIAHLAAAATAAREEFGMSHLDSLRYALQLVLVSPEFLLLHEPSPPGAPPRPLDDYELASRLSYFLWSSMPDETLFELAAAGKLREPAVLREQTARLLADHRAREFVENFAGQWLHVREFGSITPARDYRDYDAELAAAEREEPYAFFEEVLRRDLPILNFLDSDFALVNERLARFYGIEGVSGPGFRRVPLEPGHQRGGVLTMGGLLTYLADGTRTLPVRRGAWILEQMFNDPPPPPPPNAGEIQPNVRGEKLTVRERLERHRDDPTCASCHRKIDPLGLALENYDAIGAWRTQQNGEGFRNNAPPIDPSGTLLNGRSFTTPAEFKQVLLEEKDRFTRAFVEKLLTYALARPVGYVDHETIDSVVAAARREEYRLQAILQAIVASEPFLTK